MDRKELGTNSAVSTSVSDGSTKFALNSPTVQSGRNKLYDVGSNSLGKVDTAAARPCAIIGPDRVLPPNPDDTMYLKKMPGEAWPPTENIYRRPPDYPSKISDYQPTRNISPRQTFQENMQRIMVPPMFSSIKNSDESTLKNTKVNMPQEAKYCDVPYNINSVNSEHKSVRNPDIPMSNVNPSYTRNMPPPYGWPAGVNIRPLRPYGTSEFYQYQEFPSCAGPRPMTMIRPHRPLHEESAQVYSERLYQDGNIRFKPYTTGKEKLQHPRYDYISNYPSTFHPPASLPSHKYEMQKTAHGHPYPVYPPVPYKYLDRRIHEPFVDGYHRTHNQQANFNTFHNQVVPPPYGPIPGNCMQNKSYSDASSKSINVNKMQAFENNNKVYLNLESRNKNYPVQENLYYNEMNHTPGMRGEILLPTHSTVNIHPMSQHSIYRKDNTPLKSYDYPNYRIMDHSLQRIPLQFSPNTISPSDSNTSNDTAHTIGTSQEDCGYVSQSSTASIRSFDSGTIPIPHDIYRRHSYNNYDMFRNTFQPHGPIQISKNKSNSSNKKNLDVRQFLQMWNEGDEEVSEGNKEAAAQNHAKKLSQNEIANNQEELYVLGLVNVPNEDLGKYDHIQKISKLPENIKGYNSLEILNQYEELLETPHVNNYIKSREYNAFSKSLMDKEITSKLPRPVSPLDVEAKISQSVIHKEVGCNFEIKPCSPVMLNVELAAPVQNLHGERMIEKVVNPIITKSPNLAISENNSSQNIVNDAVKVASCKMISDQFSSKSSPNKIKTSNYSVQDLESSAGLCLASLPQLDNDIELNFPEINQQFIKANQIESNTPGLQNVLHINLEQTHKCLSNENKNDSRQYNISPQLALGPVGDKEISKLSKYRKGRKSEFTNSSILKQDTIKSGLSMASLQRIDSVIIKNPDTVSVRTNSDSSHDNQKESKQSYSLNYEKNIDRCDLSVETAIDFSLNRSEDETAVRYLNAIDRNVNQNFPCLGFDEVGLNDDNTITITSNSIKIQNASTNLNPQSSIEITDKLQSERLQFKITEECKNNMENIREEINEKKYDSLIKKSVKTPNLSEVNEEYNVLVMRKLATPELEISAFENFTNNTEKAKNIESPIVNDDITNSQCQESNEKILYANSKNTVQSSSKYIGEVEQESSDSGKREIDLSITVMDHGEQYNRDKCAVGLKNEEGSNVVTNISLVKKTCDVLFENNDNKEVTPEQTIRGVLDELSNQDIDNLDTKDGNSYHTAKNNSSKDITALDNSHIKDEDINENQSKKSHTEKVEGNSIDVYQSVPSESNAEDIKFDVNEKELAAVVSQQDSETKSNITNDFMSSNSLAIPNVKIETNLVDLAVETTESLPETLLKPKVVPQQDSESKMDVHGFECLLDKNVISKCNETDLSMSTVTQETKHIPADINGAKKLDTSDVEYFSDKVDVCNTYHLKNDICILKDKTLSSVKFVGSKHEIETVSTPTVQEINSDMHIDESKCLSSKTGLHGNSVEVSSSFFNKANSEDPDVISTECRHKTKIDRHLETNNHEIDIGDSDWLYSKTDLHANNYVELPSSLNKKTIPNIPEVINAECRHKTDIGKHIETNYDTNVDAIELDCIKANATESGLSIKNITCHENSVVKNADFINEPDIDIAESAVLSVKSDINTNEPGKESYLTLNNKIIGITSAFETIESIQEIEINKSVQEDFQTNLDMAESKYSSDPFITIEESLLNMNKEIHPENSTVKEAECSQLVERKDNDLIRAVELDNNKPEFGTNSSVELEHSDSIFELKDEITLLSSENESLQSFECQEIQQTQDSVINKKYKYCRKEHFSPWIQKLLMFTEEICNTNKNKNVGQEDNCDKINDVPFDNQTLEVILPKNNIKETFKQWKNEVNYEMRDIDNEANMINAHDMHVVSEISQTLNDKNNVIKQDTENLNENYKRIINENSKIAPALNDNSAVIKPLKISKRSLSESALEAYKDNSDINLVQPCKRKKLMKASPSFLDSHVITEDICNLIQTNRRNSISTFYNEDNVYIVIDNDLMLEEENNDSDKVCYTECTDEFQASIESTDCEINLNLDTESCTGEPNEIYEYSDSLQHIEEKSIEDSWVDDVACIETVFSEDVAENIIIDVQASPKKVDLESIDEESTAFFDSDHIDKIKSIYGSNICNDNTQLIETLYRTPQMNVNKTLYHNESQDPKECLDAIIESCLASNEPTDCTEISTYKVVDNKENVLENLCLNSKQCYQTVYPNFNYNNDCKVKDFSIEEQVDKLTFQSCESSKDYLTSNVQKDNSTYSWSSSPEVSSTTSEEKNSSILLKITNCNGSRVSQINEISTDSQNKLSYKLTEKGEYRSYNSNFSSSRTLITKAAQKYIPPLKETIYDLKVKLPLPQDRLHTLKQLKIAKVEPKIDATANICSVKRLTHNLSKKQKPKFEDVLKSIDEINFKRHKDNVKKGKISIPKVIIKKNENGAHYTSSKTTNTRDTYNPDLTGCKWQPWVFLEKNNFVDRMALQNKAKAVYCHRKNSYVLLEKFRKYKSVYNANFVISQPKSDTKGNLKYTIRLKHVN